MKGNKKRDTRPEIVLRSALYRAGLRFRKDFAIRPDDSGTVRVDVAFPRARVAVFVDGCFWHCCPAHGNEPKSNSLYWGPKLSRNVERDRQVDTRLGAAGWRVVRLWEHSVRGSDTRMEAVALVVSLVRDRHSQHPEVPRPVPLS